MREQLIATYLDFVNNYLTLAMYAEHNGLTEHEARQLLKLAEEVANHPHLEN